MNWRKKMGESMKKSIFVIVIFLLSMSLFGLEGYNVQYEQQNGQLNNNKRNKD